MGGKRQSSEPGRSEFSHGKGLTPTGVTRYSGRVASLTVTERDSEQSKAAIRAATSGRSA
ncbi:hypothetical protein [Rhodococcus sp. SORGH_AS_0301]|uniref:hypothetical protein n=1 Tax=Rhodococcus sp. SORGH_AS_0301 TaxID=3041780 RepID=UPI00278ABF00|nr:hypothetical protein [Rhodococcus sp. SORGH_AS_0301]MDQ1182042.1 hypothetical protein [Rhodococcus sp. SORGH_AS_0301]